MPSKKPLFSFFLCLLVSISVACTLGAQTDGTVPENSQQDAANQIQDAGPNTAWAMAINGQLDSLSRVYTKDAYKINGKGEMVNGAIKIMDLYQGKGMVINDISTKKSITAVLDSTTVYEIGNFSTPDKGYFAHLVIWRKQGDQMLRELELVEERATNASVPAEIEERRNKWMALCNAHKVTELVNEMYTENTLYYNHRPMISGREAVIKEYGYMNRPNYELYLNPIVVETVNNNLVFEIGQCSGTYPGNYVLVWRKDTDGTWRILLDSNI